MIGYIAAAVPDIMLVEGFRQFLLSLLASIASQLSL